MAQPQHACIVRSNVDGVSNSHTARKLELARSDGCPFAAWCTPAQRMSADNGERTAASIRCEPSDGLVRNLLRAPIAGDREQPIAPRCHKYRRFRHGLPSLCQLSRAIRVVEHGHAFSLKRSPDRAGSYRICRTEFRLPIRILALRGSKSQWHRKPAKARRCRPVPDRAYPNPHGFRE